MRAQDVIQLMRPRQWTKNLAVFAALIFSGNLGEPRLFGVVVVAFVALCLVTGGLYAVNDVVDAERDRQHPVKRLRPVASGRVPARAASAIGLASMFLGLAVAAVLGWPILAAYAGYVVIQLIYGWRLKDVAIVDLLIIASGFVIRAMAGALVIDVPVSPWLVLCTGLLALFLAAAKRRHELVLLKGDSQGHRPVLSEYSPALLDSFMVTLSAATITSYALYTFFEARAPHYLMMFTIPFVLYGILRYQFLVLEREAGGTPEEVLLGDRPTLANIAAWVASVIAILYLAPLFT